MVKKSFDVQGDVPEQSKTATRVGVVLTIVYACCMGVYVWCEWNHLMMMKPNEFGDFMAGAFGPLALFWLVCGYFQQGAELRQNTDALKLQSEALERQVEELEMSVQHQAELAAASRDALEFSLRESANRAEQEKEMHTPHFSAQSFESYVQNAPGLFEVQLKNDGANASIVSIESSECDLVLGQQSFLGTGDSMRIVAMKPDGFGWQPELKITVTFRNALNRRGQAVMTFQQDRERRQYLSPVITVN